LDDTSPGACEANNDTCTYDIGVHAYYDQTEYQILAQTESVVTIIGNGVPRTETLTLNRYNFYQYDLHDSSIDVTIQVTPVSGTPYLIVSRVVNSNVTE